jgi:HSP20 family protein
MAIRDLLPSPWRRGDAPAGRGREEPLHGLQQEMNRVFDDFFQGIDRTPFAAVNESLGTFFPVMDIREDAKEIVVTAELPGMDKNDFELLVTDDSLTIKGEKKEDREDKGKGYRLVERSYGYFSRVIPLLPAIDKTKVEAKFDKGVLTVRLPRKEPAQSEKKRISIAVN